MTYPIVYDITYSYTGFAAGLGDGSFPGSQLDADLAGFEASLESFETFIEGAFRSDGVLKMSALPADVEFSEGAVVQFKSVHDGETASGTTVIPVDDTIPQITEGTQFMSLAITPKSATNLLVIEIDAIFLSVAGVSIVMALFQDDVANALAANTHSSFVQTNRLQSPTLRHVMEAGTTEEITFRLRVGPSGADTIYFNGTSAGRRFGGKAASLMTITEIKP